LRGGGAVSCSSSDSDEILRLLVAPRTRCVRTGGLSERCDVPAAPLSFSSSSALGLLARRRCNRRRFNVGRRGETSSSSSGFGGSCVRWSEPSESESVDGARPFPARRLGLVPQYAGDGERAGSPAGRRRERALEGGDATKPKSVVCLIVGYPGNELVGGGKRVPVDDACGGGRSGQGQGL
jgi:hypothetical protein